MMGEPVFKRELNHSYMVFENMEECGEDYRYQMVVHNAIPGLLPVSERFLEGRRALYFDITARQSLAQVYESQKMSAMDVRHILESAACIIQEISAYLLDERCLLLEPSYIFLDTVSRNLLLAFCPESMRKENHFRTLAEFFLDHISYGDEEAVTIAYQFYKMAKNEFFSLDSFLPLLRNEFTEKRKQENESLTIIEGSSFGTERTKQEQKQELRQEPRQEVRKEKGLEPLTEGKLKDAAVGYHFWEEEEEAEEKENSSVSKLLIQTGVGVVLVLAAAVIYLLFPMQPPYLQLCVGITAGGILLCLFSLYRLILFLTRRQKEEGIKDKEKESNPENYLWDQYVETMENFSGEETVFLPMEQRGEAEKGGRKRAGFICQKEGGEEYLELDLLPATVGKAKGRVSLYLDDSTVSRVHAKILEKDGEVGIMDLNSRNGTFVNKKRLEGNEICLLKDGDKVEIGRKILTFRMGVKKG